MRGNRNYHTEFHISRLNSRICLADSVIVPIQRGNQNVSGRKHRFFCELSLVLSNERWRNNYFNYSHSVPMCSKLSSTHITGRKSLCSNMVRRSDKINITSRRWSENLKRAFILIIWLEPHISVIFVYFFRCKNKIANTLIIYVSVLHRLRND